MKSSPQTSQTRARRVRLSFLLLCLLSLLARHATAAGGEGYTGAPEPQPNATAGNTTQLAFENGEPDGPAAEPVDAGEDDVPVSEDPEPAGDSAEDEDSPAPATSTRQREHAPVTEEPVSAQPPDMNAADPSAAGREAMPAPESTEGTDADMGEDPDEPPVGAAATSAPAPAETVSPTATPKPPGLPPRKQPFSILGEDVPPGTARTVFWQPAQSFEGLALRTPVNILHGRREGPVLCLTAAVHGDELNGVEIVRRVVDSIDPKQLRGVVIGVPIVNLRGFLRNSRYLPDRRDLNRYFPGSTTGSSASRIAYSLFHTIILRCTHLIDLHTGSFHRSNLPQLRANLNNPEVVKLTQGFGSMAVLHSSGISGSLRNAAIAAGIPAVTVEAGGPMHLDPEAVATGVASIETVLDKMGMIERFRLWGDPQPVYYKSRWVRSDHGGILFSHVELGSRVSKGELLGVVTDPISNARHRIISPVDGRILGMAFNQVVMPGFAAYHVGAVTSERVIQSGEGQRTTGETPGSGETDEVDPRLDEP